MGKHQKMKNMENWERKKDKYEEHKIWLRELRMRINENRTERVR